MLPQLQLTGAYGSDSTGGLFDPGTLAWNLGAGITQPLFQGRKLYFQRRAAIEALQTSTDQYRQTVISAFQNVADTLRALQLDAEQLNAQAEAARAAADSLAASQRQYRAGAISYLGLLTAEQTYQQAQLALVQAQAARFTDTTALFQALGGGWWNRRDQPHPDLSAALVRGAGAKLLDDLRQRRLVQRRHQVHAGDTRGCRCISCISSRQMRCPSSRASGRLLQPLDQRLGNDRPRAAARGSSAPSAHWPAAPDPPGCGMRAEHYRALPAAAGSVAAAPGPCRTASARTAHRPRACVSGPSGFQSAAGSIGVSAAAQKEIELAAHRAGRAAARRDRA